MKSSKRIVTEGDKENIIEKIDVDKSMHETFSVFIFLQKFMEEINTQ